LLGEFGGREPVEIGTGSLSGLEDGLLHLPVLNKTAVDLEVRVVFVVLLDDQEFLGKFGYLGLIVR